MAARDEQASIALGARFQHRLQGFHLAGGEQAIHHGGDAPHLLLAPPKVLGIHRPPIGLWPIPLGGHYGQGIARIQQGGGRHPQLIEVITGRQCLSLFERQRCLAREQDQDLSLGRRAGRGRGCQQQ
ncbi:hypothetical protein D3C78_1397480 [compost metagenome]